MTEIGRNPYAGGRRVGLIVPSVNATIEPELAWLAIPGVSFHATRVMLREDNPGGGARDERAVRRRRAADRFRRP